MQKSFTILILIVLFHVLPPAGGMRGAFAQRAPENPTRPGWTFQALWGKNFIVPGVYPDSAHLPALPIAYTGTTGADSTRGAIAYTRTDSTLWTYTGTRWNRVGQSVSTGGNGIDSLTYRPGNIIDTLVYWTGGTPTDWYYVVNKDGLISGGQVIYTGSGLDYFVTAATFRKNGSFYSTNDTTLTLPALVSIDSSRTDVFVVNTAGQATTITGVESANPLTPQIDPDTQVFLTTITIRPGNIIGEDTLTIYDENTAPPEWVGGSTGTTVNFNNTSVVYRGTKSANVGAIANNNTFGWRGTTLLSQTDYTGSAFFVQLKQNMPANNNLNIAFFNGGTQVTNEIAIPLNKTNASSYQGIAIGFASFTWGNNLFDSIRFRYTGGGGGISGMYMDYVYLQNGLSPVITPSAIILTGDITGTGQTGSPVNTTLSNTGVVAGTYGTADSVGRFTVDAKGRLSFAQNVAIAKTDTANLSYRIDTVAANIPDTTSLSNRINLKVNISDTANMLGGYIKQAYRTVGIDTIYFIRGDNSIFGVKDSVGGAGGSTIAVDTIYRKAGQDSIFFTIAGGAERAIKDSVGSGGGGGSSQWRDTTNGIYYNGGNVGIETLNPKYRFEVFNEDSIATYPTYANAYSTTLENPTYTGSCMRVRRSSDNTEQDFGFVGGFLDTAALKTFVGANDGRVTTFYNQFGSSNFVQATAALQPHIIVSGAVQYITNKPALRFLWNSARMTNASITYALSQDRWIRANIKIDTLVSFATILNAQNVNYGIHSDATRQYIFDGSVRLYTPAFAYLDPTSIRIDSNIATANNTSTTATFTVPAVNGIVIGAHNAGSDKTRGRMSSVFFDSIGVVGIFDSAAINGTLITKKINIADANTTSDTTNFKPLTISANGTVNRFSYWPGGGGSGINTLNALTGATQTFATGTAGTNFAINSTGTTHTFNIPDASASNRGLVTTGAQTFAGSKTFTGLINGGSGAGAKQYWYDNGTAGSRHGVGINSAEMQFFVSTANRYTWNGGGDLNTSGTNEWMRLTSSAMTLPSSVSLNAATIGTFGQGSGVGVKQRWLDGTSGNRAGVGINPAQIQFFIPSATSYTWNGGGDLNTSGTNEWMRLTSSQLTLGSGVNLPFFNHGNENGVKNYWYNNGAGERVGVGQNAAEIQFFTSNNIRYTWNGGGDLNTSGTNEWMRLVSGGISFFKGSDPVATAVVEISSTTKGFLRPRLTTAQRDAISTPAEGLSVYNTTDKTNDVHTNLAWYNQPNGLKASATLDFPDTGAQLSADLTITVTGAAVSDIVQLGTPVQLANSTFTAFVSAANTVTVRLNNYSAGNINPASGIFKVYVIKN